MENKKPKFKLALCELHCSRIHGGRENGHYLVIETFNSLDDITEEDIYEDEEYEEDYYDSINYLMWSTRNNYHNLIDTFTENPHRNIRNFLNIISDLNYIKPEIIIKLKLASGHRVAILKTFWLRLIQRVWKKVFLSRKTIIELRKKICNIQYRNMTGRWPLECNRLPTIVGMLRGI